MSTALPICLRRPQAACTHAPGLSISGIAVSAFNVLIVVLRPLPQAFQDNDPAEHYMIDADGARSGDRELRTAIAYFKFFQTFAGVPRSRFLADYPEVTSALAWLPGVSADVARDRIYDLLQRHAADVLAVIGDGTTQHRDALVRGELPTGALLSCASTVVASRSSHPATTTGRSRISWIALSPHRLNLLSTNIRSACFSGEDFYLEGANYKLVAALLAKFREGKSAAAEIEYFYPPDLAKTLKIAEASLRQQVMRIRKTVADRLSVDLGVVFEPDDFIQNKERSGYRLSPMLREVAKADLSGQPEAHVAGPAPGS